MNKIPKIKPVYNKIEREVLFLSAIQSLIDDMVNREMLDFAGDPSGYLIRPNTSCHSKLFVILLADLLSDSNEQIAGTREHYLEALKNICEDPCFNVDGSVSNLLIATDNLIDWLDKEAVVENVWLPSISREFKEFRVKRRLFLKICGNISKHNYLKLSVTSEEICSILKINGVEELSGIDAVLVLEDFYYWFHEDVFHYHLSMIAELLNNITWGIYDYFSPEFLRARTPEGVPWLYPEDLKDKLARNAYSYLTNRVWHKPIMSKFSAAPYLKHLY
jgi:hypothetical protein